MDARLWLRENGYSDVADMIDEIMADWAARGVNTRRNWWDKLSGDAKGRPCRIGAWTLPVLRAAQIRQGKPVSKNALCRNRAEIPPPMEKQARWLK